MLLTYCNQDKFSLAHSHRSGKAPLDCWALELVRNAPNQRAGALWALRHGYLRAGRLGSMLQVLWSPKEPPLDLQVHGSGAALESAGHLHILSLGRSHVPRKLGKFCCKTDTHHSGVSLHYQLCQCIFPGELDTSFCLFGLFSWALKGENKNSNNNPSDISAGLPVPHCFASACLVLGIMPTSLRC